MADRIKGVLRREKESQLHWEGCLKILPGCSRARCGFRLFAGRAGKSAIRFPIADMPALTTMRSRQPSLYRIIGVFGQFAICALLFSLVGLGHAQSGRRPPKPTATPEQAAAGSEIAAAAESTTNEESLRKIKILVGSQPTSKSLPSEDVIYTSFLSRLREFPVLVPESLESLTRDQAIKRAKKETDAFVVLMQFEIDSFQHGAVVLDSPDLKITCFVFAPGSGKLKTKDKIYYQAIGARVRKDNWPNGPPLKITPAAAGIVAAERLHDWLVLVARAREMP